jgi:hypothetical protein
MPIQTKVVRKSRNKKDIYTPLPYSSPMRRRKKFLKYTIPIAVIVAIFSPWGSPMFILAIGYCLFALILWAHAKHF